MNADLKLISGIVSDLEIHSNEDESVAAGATGALPIFTCSLGGQRVMGCFGRTSFQNGDALEMVVEPARFGPANALAARRSSDRVLWVAPFRSRGVEALRRLSMRLFFWVLSSFTIFSIVLFFHLIVLEGTSVEMLEFIGSFYALIAVVVVVLYPYRFFMKWKPVAQQAECIFDALGYANPSNTNLLVEHKIYCKTNGIRWFCAMGAPWVYYYIDPKESLAQASGGG